MKILDSNSRTHYVAVLITQQGWAKGGGQKVYHRKGLDPNSLIAELRPLMVGASDEIKLWRVTGGVGLTYRIDANGKPVGRDCELVNFVMNIPIGGGNKDEK